MTNNDDGQSGFSMVRLLNAWIRASSAFQGSPGAPAEGQSDPPWQFHASLHEALREAEHHRALSVGRCW